MIRKNIFGSIYKPQKSEKCRRNLELIHRWCIIAWRQCSKAPTLAAKREDFFLWLNCSLDLTQLRSTNSKSWTMISRVKISKWQSFIMKLLSRLWIFWIQKELQMKNLPGQSSLGPRLLVMISYRMSLWDWFLHKVWAIGNRGHGHKTIPWNSWDTGFGLTETVSGAWQKVKTFKNLIGEKCLFECITKYTCFNMFCSKSESSTFSTLLGF